MDMERLLVLVKSHLTKLLVREMLPEEVQSSLLERCDPIGIPVLPARAAEPPLVHRQDSLAQGSRAREFPRIARAPFP